MALGSSAPEILLAVIEALKSIGEPSGELGPSSIVGSGAFNLLVISGISILAVDEPKKIYDLGVYSCTAFFSLFAYAWMYVCL
jgi:solute carrier family 8 (sodium/calcium exchanger)